MIARLAAVLLVTTLLPAAVQACNVPVFRYALERWKAGKFELLVFYQGPLAPAEKAVVDELLKTADDPFSHANTEVELIDLGKKPDRDMLKLYQKLKRSEQPLLVVRYPFQARIPEPIWVGRLTREAIQTVLHSPARREIARRILAGDSVVWVLLECGDKTKDEVAAKVLATELRRLEKEIKLPQLTDDPEDKLQTALPLKLAFSTLRLSRGDPKEKLLIDMLLKVEDEPPSTKEPLVIPVFGRGRALWILQGAGITPQNLTETANFLTGPCTCKVKEMSPGLDLLITADWDTALDKRVVKDRELPPLTGIAPGILPAVPKPGTSASISPGLVRSRGAGDEPLSMTRPPLPDHAMTFRSVGESVLNARLPDCCTSEPPAPRRTSGSEPVLLINVSLAVGVAVITVAVLALMWRRPRKLDVMP